METKITCPHCGKEIIIEARKNEEPQPTPKPPTYDRVIFSDLIASFNDVLEKRGYNAISSGMSVNGFLSWAFNFANICYLNNDWMFHSENYPLVYNYRGINDTDDDTAYNAMQAWLMASILAELVPDFGEETNTQTELFKLAYELGGGRSYPLYNFHSFRDDPYAMREAASVIYAIVRGDERVMASIDVYRNELGGKPIPASTWEELGYKNTMLSDEYGRKGYRMDCLGYLVNTSLFLPSAPAPRVKGTTVCDLPQPWTQGQPIEQFNANGNYIMDVIINESFVMSWNMMSETPLDDWLSYPTEKQNRLVNVAATPPCTYMYMFGAPKKIKFDGIKNKTYDGNIYANYYTFSETNKDTGLVLDGAFSDLNGIYRYNATNKSTTERLIDAVTSIADNFRFPTQDPNYGRCRAGCSPTRQGGELYPVHGAPENELYNVDIAAMVADTEQQKESMLKEDGFAVDSPRSYVSGHSAQIWMLALMLTQFDNDETERPQTWIRKAFEYSVNRSIGRFHWNSDCVYGRLFGAMALPIINAMQGLREGMEATKDFVVKKKPAPQGDWQANIIIKNETNAPIQSTGEIRLYVGDHIGVNAYLPDAWEGAGALYTFGVGETNFSDYDVHCKMNGEEYMDDAYDGAPITEVRFYDYRHWQNLDAGFNAVLDVGDVRCNRTLKKSGGTYVIKITKL